MTSRRIEVQISDAEPRCFNWKSVYAWHKQKDPKHKQLEWGWMTLVVDNIESKFKWTKSSLQSSDCGDLYWELGTQTSGSTIDSGLLFSSKNDIVVSWRWCAWVVRRNTDHRTYRYNRLTTTILRQTLSWMSLSWVCKELGQKNYPLLKTVSLFFVGNKNKVEKKPPKAHFRHTLSSLDYYVVDMVGQSLQWQV